MKIEHWTRNQRNMQDVRTDLENTRIKYQMPKPTVVKDWYVCKLQVSDCPECWATQKFVAKHDMELTDPWRQHRVDCGHHHIYTWENDNCLFPVEVEEGYYGPCSDLTK